MIRNWLLRPRKAVVLGGLLLMLSSTSSWIVLIEMPEPVLSRAARFVAFFLGLVTLGWSSLRGRTARKLLWLSMLAASLPLVLLVLLTAFDGKTVSEAVLQSNDANRLLRSIAKNDVEPNVAWIDDRPMRSPIVIRDDFTFVDGMECESFFARWPFFVCSLAGFWLFICCFSLRPMRSKWAWSRDFFRIASLAAGCGILVAVRPELGILYWNRARSELTANNYNAALRDCRLALAWDPRFDYDMTFHFELGRVYNRLGMANEQDNWATLSDMYDVTGTTRQSERHMRAAMSVFDQHPFTQFANPSIAPRYSNLLVNLGYLEFANQRYVGAVYFWQKAVNARPQNIEALYALGVGQIQLKNYPAAAEAFKLLVKDNESVGMFQSKLVVSLVYRKPITARAWSALSYCYYRLNDFDRANRCRQNSTSTGKSDIKELD
ncbi:MAG TPA: hypothetical protein VG944_13565 [Fimbriimonas sp.]|nr:hypothetical protein [Fimbriimonas sp.]